MQTLPTRLPPDYLLVARAQMKLARAAEASEAASERYGGRIATCLYLHRWRANVRHFGGSVWWALAGITSEVVGLTVAYLHSGAVRVVVEQISEQWGG